MELQSKRIELTVCVCKLPQAQKFEPAHPTNTVRYLSDCAPELTGGETFAFPLISSPHSLFFFYLLHFNYLSKTFLISHKFTLMRNWYPLHCIFLNSKEQTLTFLRKIVRCFSSLATVPGIFGCLDRHLELA